MQILPGIRVEGKADLLDGASCTGQFDFLNVSAASTRVGFECVAGKDNYLEIDYGGSRKTALWGGDIEIDLDSKTGVTDTSGFLRVGTCDGEPTGTPRTMGFGTPVVFNSVSESLYAYSGGWKQMAGGTKSVGYQLFSIPRWNVSGDLVPSILIDTNNGIVHVNGSLLPGDYAAGTGENLGTSAKKWDSLHAHAVYTDLILAPLLGTDKDGKIILSHETPGGGGTGNVETDGGTQFRIASWLTSTKLGDSPLVVDAADVTSRGSISPASGFAVGLGSNSVPWKSMYATDVYALSAKSESILSTGADGRIQGGSLPAATTSVIGGIKVGKYLSVDLTGKLDARGDVEGSGVARSLALWTDGSNPRKSLTQSLVTQVSAPTAEIVVAAKTTTNDLRIVNVQNAGVLKTDALGNVSGIISAAHGQMAWAGTGLSVAELELSGEHAFPRVMSAKGVVSGMVQMSAKNGWKVNQAGLYILTFRCNVQNLGDTTGGVDDFTIRYYLNGSAESEYDRLWPSNSSNGHDIVQTSTTFPVVLDVNETVEIRYLIAGPTNKPKLYAMECTLVQTG